MKLSVFSFILLFPGFFFYHFLIGKGFINPFLGGYFGVIAVVLLLPLAVLNIKQPVKNLDLALLSYFLIIFLIFLVSFTQYSLGNPSGFFEEMFYWSLSGLLFNVVSFFIACRIDIKLVAKIGFLLILIMSVVVFTNIGEYGIFYVKKEAAEHSEFVATYQGFARSIVVPLLISCAFYYQKSKKFYVLFLLGSMALFLNGARTEFTIFLLSFFFIFLIYSVTNFKNAIRLIALVCFLFLLIINTIEFLPDSRMFQLINLVTSSSGQARLEQITFGLKIISDYPIFGNYGHYTVLGGIGKYPHNIISAWVNLGILGMILYLLLFFSLWKTAFFGIIKYRNTYQFNVYIVFLVFVTAALITSKTYSYMLLGLLVGFYVQYKSFLRKREI